MNSTLRLPPGLTPERLALIEKYTSYEPGIPCEIGDKSPIVAMKIERLTVGSGGYQDAMFGTSWTFSGDGCGVGSFMGFWGIDMERSERAQWSEEGRDNAALATFWGLQLIMIAAKVHDMSKLIGKPILARFSQPGVGGVLQKWRIFHEIV